jgi:HSP20 family protein
MADIHSTHLKRLHGRLGEVVYQLTKVQFSRFDTPKSWQPAINAYRCTECLAICVDLAGVDRQRIDLQLEPKRLMIRGHRAPPEPEGADHKPVHVLLMEIDYGPFEREILLPSDIAPDHVTAEQRNGLLWIYLPFRPQG